jgi:hypothetical protein
LSATATRSGRSPPLAFTSFGLKVDTGNRSHFSAWKNKCKTRTGKDVPKKFKGQSKYESENKNKNKKRKRIIESDEEGKEEDELNNETVRSKKSSRKMSTEKGKGGLGLIVEKDDEDEDEDEDEIKGFSVDGNEAGMMKKRGGNDDEDDDSPSHVEGGVCLGKIWFVARGSPSGAPSLK